MKKKILIINGPNLNMLGHREGEHYGNLTLKQINQKIIDKFQDTCDIDFYQSNYEGDIIESIQKFSGDGIIINPAAYSHTSIAILDALNSIKAKYQREKKSIKLVEVHLSNVYQREEFRHKTFSSKACDAVVSGMNYLGYIYAVEFCLES